MKIKSAKYLISSPKVEQCPAPDRAEYAFIGRSNVGKSSLINMLCDKKELAKISSSPGKTQLINHFEINSGKNSNWFLVDLPGYGFAVVSQKKRKTWGYMIENYIQQRKNLVNLFVLVDSRRKPQKNDVEFINQLGQWKIPFAIVFTKSDKNKPAATTRHVKELLQELSTTWEQIPHHFITSATKREGRKEILNFIDELNKTV